MLLLQTISFMDLSYKSRKLEKSLTNDSELIKKYGLRAKKLKQRLTLLRTAPSLFDISRLPPTRLHQYKGDREGEWSIDISTNWRILFEIDDKGKKQKNHGKADPKNYTAIKILSIEDPH